MTDAANPETGAEGLSVDAAAEQLSGILSPPEKKPAQEAQPESEAPAPEVEQTEGDEAQESAQEATEAEQELAFQSLQELAEALEVPLDDLLGKVKAKVKIAGSEKDVTLAELRDGYQMESDYRKKTSELSEQRKAFEAERERLAQDITVRMNEAAQMSQFLEQQLMAEYNAVNWNELRQTDPAEFAARKQEYNERYMQIQQVKQGVALEIQRQQEEVHQKTQAEMRDLLQKEQARLVEKIPEFADETKAKQLKTEMREFLRGHGFTDAEINGVVDHRHVLMIRDAMKYRDLQSKKPAVTNKVKDAPKLLKPGSKPSKDSQNSEARRELLARLKKSGRAEDAAALIKNMI